MFRSCSNVCNNMECIHDSYKKFRYTFGHLEVALFITVIYTSIELITEINPPVLQYTSKKALS